MANKKLKKNEQQKELEHLFKLQQEVLPTIHEYLGVKLPWEVLAYKEAYTNYPFLSLTNIEGSLCEFRKYTNLSAGKGRRRYYK